MLDLDQCATITFLGSEQEALVPESPWTLWLCGGTTSQELWPLVKVWKHCQLTAYKERAEESTLSVSFCPSNSVSALYWPNPLKARVHASPLMWSQGREKRVESEGCIA